MFARGKKLCTAKCFPRRQLSHSTSTQHTNEDESRFNEFRIQLLPPSLHRQLFKHVYKGVKKRNESNPHEIEAAKEHLKEFDLWDKHVPELPNIKLDLPPLEGNNLDEHFKSIAQQQSKLYFDYLSALVKTNLPPLPPSDAWVCESGWTKYSYNKDKTLNIEQVECPDAKAYVFDCEVLANETNMPIIAVAASNHAWYSWTCQSLAEGSDSCPANSVENLIPLQSSCPGDVERLVVGHNVSYDRARVKEEYNHKVGGTRFFDTMSMHIAVSGFNGEQRLTFKAMQSMQKIPWNMTRKSWTRVGSTNSLADCYKFYCGKSVDKSLRDVFVKGNMQDVRESFNDLMWYCAKDVQATHQVLVELTPQFFTRFPHPITFAGMLLMSKMYLPVNVSNWEKYITSCKQAYESLMNELQNHLIDMASDACRLLKDDRYKHDKWLWDLDWSTKDVKLLKKRRPKMSEAHFEDVRISAHNGEGLAVDEMKLLGRDVLEGKVDCKLLKNLLQTHDMLPKNQTNLPGYPEWFKNFCLRLNAENWRPGPVVITTLMRATPKLMRMTWMGLPLHYDSKLGWGYLSMKNSVTTVKESDDEKLMSELKEIDGDDSRTPKRTFNTPPLSADSLPPGYLFHRLPHPQGVGKNVGNPLSKDFSEHVQEGGVLGSAEFENVARFLEINKICSYWRGSQKRINDQFLLDGEQGGAIVPQVAVSGTVSRRAVEKTWLTASNARKDRIGSELKGLVQAPPGHCFVGADVDSEELWIASLFGDSLSAGKHGCTGISWMTLQGTKRDGTDLHSATAKTAGMDRDHAKVFNYARLYGAGKLSALRTYMNHNKTLSREECLKKVNALFRMTKGEVLYKMSADCLYFVRKLEIEVSEESHARGYATYKEILKIKEAARHAFSNEVEVSLKSLVEGRKWFGGVESCVYNKLEEIATSEHPTTPVLNSRITRALEPHHVGNDFMTGRMNWVVQSSAVDFLHLLLVSVQWLIDLHKIDARFSISIHDEVRYLSHERDSNRLALALHLANLYTRAMFAYKLGMDDLPLSVAFFSEVDVDRVQRKNPSDDCISPSNPTGLLKRYGIPLGETLDIHQAVERTNGGSLRSR